MTTKLRHSQEYLNATFRGARLTNKFYHLLGQHGEEGILGWYSPLRVSDVKAYVNNFAIQMPDKENADFVQNMIGRVEHADNFPSLYLFGDSGCGKTILTCWMAYSIIKNGPRLVKGVRFINVVQLMQDLRPPNNEWGLLEDAKTANILILDDMGSEVLTPWVLEQIYSIINYRRDALKPTWITSNYSLGDHYE